MLAHDLAQVLALAKDAFLAFLPAHASLQTAALSEIRKVLRLNWAVSSLPHMLVAFAAEKEAMARFKPLLDPSEVDAEQREHASTQLKKLRTYHVKPLVETYDKEWDKEKTCILAKSPYLVKEESGEVIASIEKDFRKAKYYEIMEWVIENITSSMPTVTFQPRIPVSDLPECERQEAENLLCLVRDVHVPIIESRVAEMLKEEMGKPDLAALRPELRERVEACFLKTKYFKVVRSVLDEDDDGKASPKETEKHSEVSSMPATVQSNSQALEIRSPLKRGRPMEQSGNTRNFRTKSIKHGIPVRGIHLQCKPADVLEVDAFVLWMPEATKQQASRKDRNDNNNAVLKSVLPILIGDATGPITLEFWGEAAGQAFDALFQKYTETAESTFLKCKFEEVEVSRVQPHPVTNMFRLRSTKRTKVSAVEELGFAMSPLPDLYLSDFHALWNAKSPYSVSICGTVVNSENIRESNSGTAMKFFGITDSSGRWIRCIAYGTAAEYVESLIFDGVRVICFFGSAKINTDRPDENGAIWFFDPACFIGLGEALSTPPLREEIQIRATTCASMGTYSG